MRIQNARAIGTLLALTGCGGRSGLDTSFESSVRDGGTLGVAGESDGAPEAAPASIKPPPAGPLCWASQLPAEVQPIPPSMEIDESCARNRNAAWMSAPPTDYDMDGRADLVGRWVPCDLGDFSGQPHQGVEFGANGRF